ncbi:bifunctional diaminohydroxyphosphoribosylaminopyrimidine deaminase/5-amino-6-(5-phosphoribosylamino)uracil reductase RibD [Maribacter sp. X9]|uniref:bifunctional diaminohydroxyphosphoribosylaminopyrimidine deaminase/5-amino-6-(5-phosphoribosylamino)uracil reductase RibD n=1 Tax=Maribacter sp. X9 TaxID=3402159 RepID=UPI003AF36601
MSNKNPDFNFTPEADLDLFTTDEKFMHRAIQIAKNGLGQTAPNPMVGAVIVYDSKIIGEGFTSPFGGPHAEVNAIASVKEPSLLKSSTLYVTLEPCSHYGKTPPCADLIIKHKIPKVVVGLRDPHEKVAGKGIQKLEEVGCQVTVGTLEKACAEHHKRFLTFHTKKRPYLILKWAETFDGFLAPEPTKRGETKEPYWITNPKSRQLVHKWRSEEQGILVGTSTVLADNPQLNLRNWDGRPPKRIVLDRSLKIPHHCHVFDGTQPTLVCTDINDEHQYQEGITYRLLDFKKNVPQQLCQILFEEQIQSVIIEGGARTLECFIESGLWDEARIFKGSTTFGKGLKAPRITGTIQNQYSILTDQLTVLTP